MSGTTPRQKLAERIQADNPAWIVNDFPMTPKQVGRGKPVVSIWRSEVNPEKRLHLRHELTIQLYGSKKDGVEAENELDGYFDELMLSIERFPGCILGKSSRRHFAEAFTGWDVTVSVLSNNIYRAAVIEERTATK